MSNLVAIRRETKSPWERRAPLTPEVVRSLVREAGVRIAVQSSSRRVFGDEEYVRAGAEVVSDLSAARVVLGVKEVPPELLEADTTYLFFAHVIKGQPYNMPMLSRLLELGCTLVDYELVCDDAGRRLIFFGRYAGLAGMIDTLWTLGRRLRWEGLSTPLTDLEPAHRYADLEAAQEAVTRTGAAISEAGIPAELRPLVIGIAGYGNVARGSREILSHLPIREVAPGELASLDPDSETARRHLFVTTFEEAHLVEPRRAGATFDLEDYYQHPGRYRSVFTRHLDHLTVLVNATYWDDRYPRLVRLEDLQRLWVNGSEPRLRVIADLGCDLHGAIECTVRITDPDDPVYVYNPTDGTTKDGVAGRGPVVLAVDILPAELPREASAEFARTLGPYLPALARADLTVPVDRLQLPPELRRAVVLHRGELTPGYAYLETHLRR